MLSSTDATTPSKESSKQMIWSTQIHRRISTEWVPGTIVERKGRVNYNVLLDTGRLISSHTNQLKHRHEDCGSSPVSPNLPWSMLLDEFNLQPMVPAIPEVPDDPAAPVIDEALPIVPEVEPDDDFQDVEATNSRSQSPAQSDRPARNRKLAPYDLF